MPKPTFLLIGGQKCGTTSLVAYLHQHPRVFFSARKEPQFFALEGQSRVFHGPGDGNMNGPRAIRTIEDYLALFGAVRAETAIGEGSTMYLSSTQAPERIAHHLPDAKLIAILRDPVERAYSSFLHLARDEREPLRDFVAAFDAEDARMADGWSASWAYRSRGFYARHLRRYLDIFPRERLKIFLYDDFRDHPLEVVREIFRFIGVHDTFVPDMSFRLQRTGLPRSRRLHRILKQAYRVERRIQMLVPSGRVPVTLEGLRSWNLVRPPLPAEIRRQLIKVYWDDLIELQALLGRDLSHWMRA